MFMVQDKFVLEDMATVIGIFEDFYKRKKPLTVVKPGSQSRRFTHISRIRLKHVIWPGKIISLDIIVFQIKKSLYYFKCCKIV